MTIRSLFRTARRDSRGLSLTELLVTIAVLGVITAITLPLMFSQQTAAHRATAIADARGWSLGLVESLADVWNFGESGGTITMAGETLTVTMTNPVPADTTVIDIPVAVSPNSSLLDGTIAGTSWCIQVQNQNEVVVFTQRGFEQTASGCAADGTASYS